MLILHITYNTYLHIIKYKKILDLTYVNKFISFLPTNYVCKSFRTHIKSVK